MADVGVLNLQIHDNSEQAVQGLGKLEGALGSIKRAVADGLKLSGVARQIKSIADVVNNDIKDSTLQKIREFGDSLSGLKGLGNVRITIKDSGASHLRETLDQARSAVDGINDGFGMATERMSEANRQFDAFYSRARETAELMQNTNWSGGFAEFKQMLDLMLQAKSAFAIGAGEAQGRLTSGYGDVRETGWTYYNPFGEAAGTGWQEWKEGAIEVEGTVSDAAESIGGYLEGTQLRLTGVVEKAKEVKQATDGILESTIRMNAEMRKKYAPLPERSFEDVYNGMRWGRDKSGNDYKYKVENDLTARWLRGEGTDNEQKYALEQTARQFGMTVEEVKNRIEELKSSAQSAAPAVTELANSMQSATNQKTGMDKVSEFMDYSQIDLMTMKMNGMKDALAQDIEANKLDNTEIANRIMQIQRLQWQIDQLRQTQECTYRGCWCNSRRVSCSKDSRGICRCCNGWFHIDPFRNYQC